MIDFMAAILGFMKEPKRLNQRGIFDESNNEAIQSYYKKLENQIDEGWTTFADIEHLDVVKTIILTVVFQRFLLSFKHSIIKESLKPEFDSYMSNVYR